MRRLASLASILLLAGCAVVGSQRYDERFGKPDPERFDMPRRQDGQMSFRDEVQPILDRRCVVCHACYDASCQLKLTSWEGVARGASKTQVYDPARLDAAPTTRLHIDAEHTSEWRQRGFFPVLNEQLPSMENNRSASLLYRMLALKQTHPTPSRTDYQALDFALDRRQTCAAGEEFESYAEKNPLGGMPFGLPALSAAEHASLTRWLEQGAPGDAAPESPAEIDAQVQRWERFLNGRTPKQQLVSRYLFEHLYLAHLYFDEPGDRPAAMPPRYFRLVRSSTPPGEPVREIASRRPVDAPGMDVFHYRLRPERETIVDKTHMPYVLNSARMARWQSLFLDRDYEVGALPGYAAEDIANPFRTFRAIPVVARHRFLLDEAGFTVMNFIKGPVCRGQVALNVIDDHFWVFFTPPEQGRDSPLEELLAKQGDLLRLPTGESNTGILMPWLRYSELESSYVAAKSKFLARQIRSPKRLNLDLIWNGDGRNNNAALTVFRHFDSASVVKGLLGDTPKTAWIIGYPMLERIHYLLVANYDVYGNLGHQLNSRLYMEYLRMEGEFNTLILLPQAARTRMRDHWYRGDSARTRKQVYGGKAVLPIESGIRYRTDEPMRELMTMARQKLAPVLDRQHELAGIGDPALRQSLERLAAIRGKALAYLPELSHLVIGDGADNHFTLIRNTGHSTVSHLLGESGTLLPEENTLTVARGLIGSYPNAFYRIKRDALPQFAEELAALASEADYTRFADRHAMRRSDPEFWAFSDALHARHAQRGLLDYNRLENR